MEVGRESIRTCLPCIPVTTLLTIMHIIVEGITPDILCHLVEGSIVEVAAQQIQHEEVCIDSKTIVDSMFLHECITIIPSRDKHTIIYESIDIKRNARLATEEAERQQLLVSVMDNLCHRSRPVQQEDQTMILAIRTDSDFFEEIFVEFVSVEFLGVKHTSARD